TNPIRCIAVSENARGPGNGAPGASLTAEESRLEVEVVDVVLVEDEGRPEDDHGLVADRVRLAVVEGGDRERLAGRALDLTGDQLRRDVVREVAEVGDAPQAELRRGAVGNERLHVVRQAEAGHLDRAARLLHDL